MVARLSHTWTAAMSGIGLQLHLFPPPTYLALFAVSWGSPQDPPGLEVQSCLLVQGQELHKRRCAAPSWRAFSEQLHGSCSVHRTLWARSCADAAVVHS